MSIKDATRFEVFKTPIIIAFIALLVRVLLIVWMPDAYQFDAYQRWAGRDYLYIQVWLPATQSLVWVVGKLGGTPVILRVFFSTLGAVTIGMIVQLALSMREGIDGENADPNLDPFRYGLWLSLPFVVFGPYVVWSSVPYQESTLLFFLMGGLLLNRIKPEWGDLCIGALALVRYEGWPIIVVHWLLRRNLKAVVLSSWGIVLWLSIKYFGLLTPYMASPDSFSDWNELSENLTPRKARHLFRQLWLMFDSSAAGWFLLAATPLIPRWRKWDYRHWMLFWAFLGQGAALIGWLFSLGIAFSRMIVLPVMIMAPFSIVGLLWAWARWKNTIWKRRAFIFGLIAMSGWTIRDIYIDITAFNKHNRWERALVQEINQCEGDSWSIYPRIHNGPRSRHDGCEVVQGLTNLRAGEDFSCVPWGWGGPMATIIANWDDKTSTYEVERVGGERKGPCSY